MSPVVPVSSEHYPFQNNYPSTEDETMDFSAATI